MQYCLHLIDKLKGIDLTGNRISDMGEDVFRSSPQLEQIVLSDNLLQALPWLPATMRHIDVRNNKLTSAGMHPEGFKVIPGIEVHVQFCTCTSFFFLGSLGSWLG